MPELSAEGAVLFEQIGDRVRVALVELRGEGEEEKAHGRRINHGGQHSAERLAFDGRLINRTLRARRRVREVRAKFQKELKR